MRTPPKQRFVSVEFKWVGKKGSMIEGYSDSTYNISALLYNAINKAIDGRKMRDFETIATVSIKETTTAFHAMY